jgi:cysteinyl-tRNA synthetase
LGILFSIVKKSPSGIGKSQFDQAIDILGFTNSVVQVQFAAFMHKSDILEIPLPIVGLAEKRWAAKQAKDFAGADALRKELTAAGWSMLDGKDGYKLEPIKK